MKKRTIALEEHYSTPEFIKLMGNPAQGFTQIGKTPHPHVSSFEELTDRLCDVGEGRIAEMDAAGIDVQVLSLSSPGIEQTKPEQSEGLARMSNDFVASAIERFPSRLTAFASLPTSLPEKAADELERTVKDYGFRGAVVNGNILGRYLDDRFFWPILERAESIGVPLYIHPAPPPEAIVKTYYSGGFQPGVTYRLSTAGWGWHIDTAVHVLRLIMSGAFDVYPRLQVIVGHLGEALPFMMKRLEENLPASLTKLDRSVGEYLRGNVHYTISGFNYVPSFLTLLMQVGVDRIMFSTDYPYSSMGDAMSFLDSLPTSLYDRERISHINAERLMKL